MSKVSMKFNFYSSLLLCLFLVSNALGQKGLFETKKLAARKGFLLGANGNFDMPGGDLKNRFGNGYRLGASMAYKTQTNWIFGVKFDFNNGDQVKEDSLFSGIKDNANTLINQDGQRLAVNIYRRGFMAGIEGGYIFNTSKTVSDNGIMLLTGIGFMQHKILIQDKGESILSLRGESRKGYDRLANGIYLEQYLGYLFLSNSGLINFHIGLDLTVGFNQGRRDFLYDVRRPGNEKRTDIMFGVRGGWYLPMFKRKSEEFFFE
jgi:hypothetical protein